MWSHYPTDDELRLIFEETLAAVVAGGGPTSCSWFDLWTDTALSEIIEAYSDATDPLIAQARTAFAGQLTSEALGLLSEMSDVSSSSWGDADMIRSDPISGRGPAPSTPRPPRDLLGQALMT